jgi:cytosine permease
MNQVNPNTSSLPAYIAGASPNPPEKRAPWYANTAPTYAGIFLWFVFWQGSTDSSTLGGVLSQGIGPALLALVLSALLCHFLFYLVPGMLGMKSGLPLYIVGTSTFGVQGGFFMPGFLMGLLQFGWLGVNCYFAGSALSAMIPVDARILMVVWGILAAFLGLKGIQYVAKVATYLPLIPLLTLIILFVKTSGGLSSFSPQDFVTAHKSAMPATGAPLDMFALVAFVITYVVGFFATAGAAGVDFGSGNRNESDVKMGGLVGVALAIVLTAGLAMLIVAGTYGTAELKTAAIAAGSKNTAKPFIIDAFNLIPVVLGEGPSRWIQFLLAISAFPSACFSSLIAANCFKTTLPNVNSFLSVGIGAAVSIILAVTGVASQLISVFGIIGASFGPICGAMMVDYFLAGKKWAGPRAGFNTAGWVAWALGFAVGILPNLHVNVPAAPLLAFIVGAVVYFVCAKAGLESATLPFPAKKN